MAAPPQQDRQARLLGEIEAIYLAEGFRGSTVGELAARLRCSRRALYELAPSKEELFLRVLGRPPSPAEIELSRDYLGAGPARRALLIHALFNRNEFVTIR